MDNLIPKKIEVDHENKTVKVFVSDDLEKITVTPTSKHFYPEDKSIKIINTGGDLVATMPNGDVIPMQIKMLISDDLSNRGFVHCEVTLHAFIDISDFEIIKSK